MSHYSQNFEKYKEFLNRKVRYDFAMFDLPLEGRILDMGCGFGDRIRLLQGMGCRDVHGIDIDAHMVSEARKQCATIREGSITASGWEAGSFDAVLVENIFHHIADYDAALAEVARILKPQGLLCLIEPRNSLSRKALDFVTFKTPVPRWLGGPWALRYAVMKEEMDTGLYPKWLVSQDEFRDLLRRRFDVIWWRRNPWFFMVKTTRRG